MTEFTLILPFYRNVQMLRRQVEEWNKYPPGVRVICVDDGSPEPALPIIVGADLRVGPSEGGHTGPPQRPPLQLYRITKDIPWNRGGARNLGAKMATTDLIMQADIDHILPVAAAVDLLEFLTNHEHEARTRWFRFPRWRVGKADATRRKDKIPDDVEYGEIHPHLDSYLVRKEVYWAVGGYNEDYSGAIGGGNAFLNRLEAAQPVAMLPAPIRLEVYTRDVIKDASDWSLSRDPTEYSRRKRIIERNGNKPTKPLRFEWAREL